MKSIILLLIVIFSIMELEIQKGYCDFFLTILTFLTVASLYLAILWSPVSATE